MSLHPLYSWRLLWTAPYIEQIVKIFDFTFISSLVTYPKYLKTKNTFLKNSQLKKWTFNFVKMKVKSENSPPIVFTNLSFYYNKHVNHYASTFSDIFVTEKNIFVSFITYRLIISKKKLHLQ